jgi:hypothetical protein
MKNLCQKNRKIPRLACHTGIGRIFQLTTKEPDMGRFHEGRFGRSLRRILVFAALTAVLGSGASIAQPEIAGATTYSRTTAVQQTQTTAITNWSVYAVRLTATDSWNESSASGYVWGASCNVFLPTGAGYFCNGFSKGSYRSSNGVWEDWLNYRVSYISPLLGYEAAFSNCVYLRVDTRPNGSTTYQSFASMDLPFGHSC